MKKLIFMGITLSACTPLLTQEVQQVLRHVDVAFMPERIGQQLRQALFYRLHSERYPKWYQLKVNLQENAYNLDLGRDAKSNLLHVSLMAKYQLIRLKDGKVIGEGTLPAHNYKVLTYSYYSQTTSDTFIRDNNIRLIAQGLIQEIAHLLSQEAIANPQDSVPLPIGPVFPNPLMQAPAP